MQARKKPGKKPGWVEPGGGSREADGRIVESREVREDELGERCPPGWTREPKLAHPWYEGGVGQGLGLLFYLVLGILCFLLARLGSRWSRAASAPGEGENGPGA